MEAQLMGDLVKYFRELVNIPGLAGHEQRVCKYMADELSKMGLEPVSDVHGNCIAKIKGTAGSGPVMIFAHMDSLGFLVKHIDDKGFIKLERLGGIPEKVMPATKVVITSENGDDVNGVIGVKAHHITPPEEKYKVIPYGELYVDIGAKSKAEVLEMGIDIGCPVVYRPDFTELTGGRVQATTIDDRGGCAVLLALAAELVKEPPAADIYIVGTVQEEYNLRGAMMASRSVKPKAAIAIDCAPSGDTPDLKDVGGSVLGEGPVMTLYNFHGRGTLNGTLAHPAMVRLMKQASQASSINMQKAAYVGGLTDLAYLQLEGEGVIGIDMGFPMRYAHSPVELCDTGDMQNLVTLLNAAVRLIDNNTDWSR
jgi:putative aminopeptidase FrvX